MQRLVCTSILVTKKSENVDELILQVDGFHKLVIWTIQQPLKLFFAPAVVPLITRLEEQFTQYDIEQISELSSAYAVRLYELLICWRSTGKTPIIDLTEFRKRLGVLDTEYTRTDNLKMRVIELGLKQINEHTDITASYEQHKKGGQSQDSHSSLSRRRKQGRKCQKIAILAHISKNLVKSCQHRKTA